MKTTKTQKWMLAATLVGIVALPVVAWATCGMFAAMTVSSVIATTVTLLDRK